jgi:multiple sugar transport system permease protein
MAGALTHTSPIARVRRGRPRVGVLLSHAGLIGGSLIMLIPLYWMLITSLKTLRAVNEFPPSWVPNPVVLGNYAEALSVFPFWLYLTNTLLIVLGVIGGNLISCSLVAYAFAKLEAPGKSLLFGILLATLMLPEHVTLIPVYILFQRLGWIDTFLPLIVPSWFARSAFSVFLLRQFFLTLPRELSDAARIDGASHLTILTRIVVPLSKPALAAIAVFSFLGVWNDFLHPVIYLNSESKFTLALGLLALIGQSRESGAVEWQLVMAATTVMMVPVVVVFFFAQRHFIQGIALTGLKG